MTTTKTPSERIGSDLLRTQDQRASAYAYLVGAFGVLTNPRYCPEPITAERIASIFEAARSNALKNWEDAK